LAKSFARSLEGHAILDAGLASELARNGNRAVVDIEAPRSGSLDKLGP
jgi:hypothetical protein